jgi:hypothetical protein
MTKKDLTVQQKAKFIGMHSGALHTPCNGDHEDAYDYCCNYGPQSLSALCLYSWAFSDHGRYT